MAYFQRFWPIQKMAKVEFTEDNAIGPHMRYEAIQIVGADS